MSLDYIFLQSSHGSVTASSDHGLIIDVDLDNEWEGELPTKLDIEEWHKRYPTEDIAGCHDILDFGYWTASGAYEPPCEDWRTDREERLKQEAEEDSWETVPDDEVRTVWECSKCGLTVQAAFASIADGGPPYCVECDEYMEYQRTEIKRDYEEEQRIAEEL